MQIEGQPRPQESLDTEIDVLFESERDLNKLSMVRFLNGNLSVENEKVEWQDDEMPPETFIATAGGSGTDWDTVDDITDLPVATAQISKLKVGDVLELPTGSEHVVVSSINVSAQTINLQKRGWGGTTATAQGTSAFTVKIIGNAQIDGSDPIDASYYAPTERYNYVQIFEDSLAVSGKVMRSKVSRESERARQLNIKVKRLLSQLNNALVNGSREKTGNRATFQGLRDTVTNVYNVNGALTLAKIYDALIAMEDAGGSPSAIHGSATVIGIIERLLTGYVTSSISDYNSKLTVEKVSLLGDELELHVDKHMRDGEFFILDYGRIRFGTMDSNEAKGSFSAIVTKENGKQLEEEIVGYYTMKIKQPGASIVKAYGITN